MLNFESKRITKDVRKAINVAFNRLGGVEYLVALGKEDPKIFCALLAKIIPSEVNATVTHKYEKLSDDDLKKQLALLIGKTEPDVIDITPPKQVEEQPALISD